MSDEEEVFDYVVVGSGAGGGPLAANLARAGHRVLVLEAGGHGGGPNYDVPLFHPFSTEDASMRWDYFVRHYQDDARQAQDSKYVAAEGGVLYPRAGTLGGCTAHHALITVCPHNQDWDDIARATGDPSWASANMHRYFERMERCQYVRRSGVSTDHKLWAALVWIALAAWALLLRLFGKRVRANPARHGYEGWLSTSVPNPRLLLEDPRLLKVVLSAAASELAEGVHETIRRVETQLDPNDWRNVESNAEGICLTPVSTRAGKRLGTRELLVETARLHPDRLILRTECLVTRVILDDDRRATGVEYVAGARIYRADPSASAKVLPAPRRVKARREVILAAGAFNTPQLLMLSGIGPADELRRHGIPVRVALPGVGQNLQDRYEIGVVSEMDEDFSLLAGASFRAPAAGEQPDRAYRQWLAGKGPYVTNGVAVAVVKRSRPELPVPDLYLFGVPGHFRGYYPGYAREVVRQKNVFTWAVLKAHTENRGGSVRLRSADPRDTPEIVFRYFEEGTDAAGADLDAVATGIDSARRIMAHARLVTRRELVPGPEVATRAQVKDFIRREAWGHHASCSCKLGPASDPLAVVDARFRVHGVAGLRVVDASVFPRIPGFFIVTSIYMISEKASDMILEDARAVAAAEPARAAAQSVAA